MFNLVHASDVQLILQPKPLESLHNITVLEKEKNHEHSFHRPRIF